ncbi:MAG: enoyl-CoA hydratase-related protein [Miltoncostaeaceae bacterium]
MSVDLERRDSVALLTLNQPKALNALSADMLSDLDARLDEVEADPALRAVVITGSGEKAFCAGADVKAMSTATPVEARAFALQGQGVMSRIENMSRPVVAAINGFALGGGCELALACDIRMAADGARLGQPEVTLGILPGWGGTQRLARVTSLGFAKDLVMTGRLVDAKAALAAGLVTHIHPADELLDAALKLAGGLAAGPAWAVGEAKAMCNLALSGDHRANLARELDVFALAFSTHDQTEGMAAFLERRTPEFAPLNDPSPTLESESA